MPPSRPMKMPKSVIDLIWPDTLSPFLWMRGEGFPRIAGDLLHAERDAATLFVHVQHHDLHFVADLHDLGRVDVLVGPVHLGHVHQAFDARLDLDERAVIGDVGDLAEHAGVGRVATGDVVPRILAQLLEAEADAVALAVVLEHADVELLRRLPRLRTDGARASRPCR